MAEMLIDGAKLDACNTAEADAIRAKTGSTDTIPYDYANNKGFADAIAAIQTGGANREAEMIGAASDGTPLLAGTYRNEDVTVLRPYAFINQTGLTKLELPNILRLTYSTYAMSGCRALTSFHAPLLQSVGARVFENCVALTALEMDGGGWGDIRNLAFSGCSALNTLVLRQATRPISVGASGLQGTPFANGGSGGTIYIPKVLYDHLGDGSTLDYKAATNWSTYDGYGTITWVQIEGSYYETHYADGTEIV